MRTEVIHNLKCIQSIHTKVRSMDRTIIRRKIEDTSFINDSNNKKY